jgi:hypothetical protein
MLSNQWLEPSTALKSCGNLVSNAVWRHDPVGCNTLVPLAAAAVDAAVTSLAGQHCAESTTWNEIRTRNCRSPNTVLDECCVSMRCRLKSTPLLLAASSGALSTLKCLIDLGAYVLRYDENGNNAIHLAAMRYHANVLEFFIQWNHAEVDVWNTLVGM